MACKKEINNSQVLSSCPESTSKFLMVNPLGTDFQLLPKAIAMECFLGIPYIKVTGADFENATDFIDSDLDGKTIAILYTGIPNVLQDETDPTPQWQYLAGGGFRILLPNFNAKSGDSYIFYVFIQGITSGELNTIQWSNILGKPIYFPSVQGNKITLQDPESIVMNPSTAPPNNQFLTVTLIQGTGNNTVIWGDKYVFGQLPVTNYSTDINAQDRFVFQYDADDDKYYFIGQGYGFYQS